ncbi:unnamed protein product [Ixodes hexagonus]
MRSMTTIKILTLTSSVGSVAPVEIGIERRCWSKLGRADRKASPEAATHDQLSGAVPCGTRCVTVRQEGQGPVGRLLEKSFNRPHHPLHFAVGLGALGLLVTWEKP